MAGLVALVDVPALCTLTVRGPCCRRPMGSSRWVFSIGDFIFTQILAVNGFAPWYSLCPSCPRWDWTSDGERTFALDEPRLQVSCPSNNVRGANQLPSCTGGPINNGRPQGPDQTLFSAGAWRHLDNLGPLLCTSSAVAPELTLEGFDCSRVCRTRV